MKTNPIAFAARAKGVSNLLRRARRIIGSYGLTPAKMDQALHLFVQTLGQFDCGASFPITTVALKRNSSTITKYLDQNIEFIVHGYTHTDYSHLTPEEQLIHLHHARETFADIGITAVGFRSPYLRRGTQLYATIAATGFSYVSNQPIMWEVIDASDFTPPIRAVYERTIDFYDPWLAHQRLSLPQFYGELVEIPVSLPDDEILLERLGGAGSKLVEQVWLCILSQTHQRGELFTIQLHPERIAQCVNALSAVLDKACTLTPPVWLARLDEISAWWRARTATTVEIIDTGDGGLRLVVSGPDNITVLARAVKVDTSTIPWADGYRQVKATTFTARAPLRPFIGISPTTSPRFADFLRQQGYIVEISRKDHLYSHYFDQTEFVVEQERSILNQIEAKDHPLIRLGRWPNGAHSALAITGDIDALTLWDYGLRFWER